MIVLMHCQFVSPNLIFLFLVPNLALIRVCSWFASFAFCANANLILTNSKEQTGGESIVYSVGTVTPSSSFTKPDFKNQTSEVDHHHLTLRQPAAGPF